MDDVSLTCLHEASQASLHHGGSAVDVLLLRLQRRQLAQHVLAGVLQTLTTSRITHTHACKRTHTHEHTQDEWPTATERRMEMEEDKKKKKKKKKKKVKRLERGRRNRKRNAEGSQSSKWFVYNRFKVKADVINSLLQP